MIEEYKSAIDKYIEAIKYIPIKEAKEHTYRTPLENLINSIKFPTLNITPIHEGKAEKLDVDGTPDFFIYKDENTLFKTLVGFIECKKISFNLETLINSEQIKKYSKTSENIIITNYREFILLQKGSVQKKVSILTSELALIEDKNAYQNLVNLFIDFYGYEYQYIKTKKSLVSALATQSFYYSVSLREYIEDKSNESDMFYYKFKSLFEDFQKSIQYHYELVDFCDIYAQSLVYGLLLSRLDTHAVLDEAKRNYLDGIPDSYQLLYEFLESAYSNKFLPPEIKVALTNIGKNLNLINIESIQKEFNKVGNGKTNIAVYLYEDFLKQYDELRKTEKRKEGGVYYTPKEAADFIIRGVNDIIKTSFELNDGFLSPNVKVLDFACGTGTFLDSIFDLTIEKDLDDLDKIKIKEKLLNDFYGFEILFTPYIISHTILAKHLKDKGLNLFQNERLGVYLTNTLDISQHSISGHLPNLKKEHEKATKVKNEEDVLAIVGNPPYFSGKSQSEKSIIDDELYQYKKDIEEKNIRPLGDLYIKFIRFAEWKIAKAGYGIVGIITNNSWLDGITHRQMRKHLYDTFDDVYIINLHGNTRKGDNDKNIFDIMVGINITFFVKKKVRGSEKQIFYFSTLENNIISRADKLEFLQKVSLDSIKFVKIEPEKTADYWFVNKDLSQSEVYQSFWKITDIFKEYNSGISTANDDIAINYFLSKLEEIVEDFKKEDKSYCINKYGFVDKSSWCFDNVKKDLLFNYNLQDICYRIFDKRYTYMSQSSNGFIERPRYNIMKHFDNKDNLGLCFERSSDNFYKNIFVATKIIDCHFIGSKSYIGPLYIYESNKNLFDMEEKKPNWTDKFVKDYLDSISFKPTPEQIMAYIYAVLYSPVYRTKYIEFLKTDFPAIPMTKNKEVFEKYAEEGQKLIDTHLLNNLVDDKSIKVSLDRTTSNFVIKKIIAPTATEQSLSLTTADNRVIKFEGITSEVYDFEIGSYKPIDKWLKYRIKDGVILNVAEDVSHIKNMAIAIQQTIKTMQTIESFNEDYLK